MKVKTVAIGCDHAGFPYKDRVIQLLTESGIKVLDFGTGSDESVDYPDYVHPVARQVEEGTADAGVVFCGSGNGVAMTVNKYAGIRAAVCWEEELAALARKHNDANIIALPVRFITEASAVEMVKIFLSTDFEGGRHARRVGKINPC